MKRIATVLAAAAALTTLTMGCAHQEEEVALETPPSPPSTMAAEPTNKGVMGPPGPSAADAGSGKTVTTPSGLKYEDIKVGTGPSPKLGDTVTVHYTGTLTDGTKFDSSRDRGEPAQFRLGEVIEGWNEGLQTMKAGGRRKLTIPGNLAYGPQPPPGSGIPPDATLLFDVELLKVE